MTWMKANNVILSHSPRLPWFKARLVSFQRRNKQHQANAPASSSPTTSPKTLTARQAEFTPSTARLKKRALDRDVLVSVLEASATRRDAKGYLQTYASENGKVKPVTSAKQDGHGIDQPIHVAIVKLRAPQHLDNETLDGVARTITQLRVLGLLSLVVVDCGLDESRDVFQDQALRLCEAIESFGRPTAKLIDNVMIRTSEATSSAPSFLSQGVRVDDPGFLSQCLMHGMIPVIPSIASQDELSLPKPCNSNQVVLALTRYLTGYQFHPETASPAPEPLNGEASRPTKIASVQRVIILDPLGGTPKTGRPGTCHRFINLEQEYGVLIKELMGPEGSPVTDAGQVQISAATHASNLSLAKEALAMLPASSSTLITTPFAAANNMSPSSGALSAMSGHRGFAFDGMVTTRKRQNPLLHNLLTDKPVYSSSLPVQRIQNGAIHGSIAGATTLIKRGMPVTIYPNPRTDPWTPPPPGSPRLRLTDRCVDLPRLIHLIEDSFNRKLDVEDYLNRVNENLAGIIIAGEYEGGAILTWEKPSGKNDQEPECLVPYLDKFAVLKSQQGSGGVADIVFNAMVRDCFPDGVCWRSRKNNPVNKWYFERSLGTKKLSESNWTMFWTTPGLDSQHPTLLDYEDVCRSVEPSWADNKHILD